MSTYSIKEIICARFEPNINIKFTYMFTPSLHKFAQFNVECT